MRNKLLLMALAGGVLVLDPGCAVFRRSKKSPPPAPPPVAAKPSPVKQPKAAEAPMPAPDPQAPVVAPSAQPDLQKQSPIPEPPRKAGPQPRSRRSPSSVSKSGGAGQKAAPAPATLPAAPPAAPQTLPSARLGEVLSKEQQVDLLNELERNAKETNQLLESLKGRSLSREDSQSLERAQTFLNQAHQMKESDLGSAVQLSRRALLLARDLVANLR